MADKKQDSGVLGVLSNWWESKSAPPKPSRIPAVDPRTGNRTRPSPEFSWIKEGIPNMVEELRRSHYGADYLRDLAKGVYRTATNLPSFSELAENVNRFGNAADQFFAAREFEKTGKWPKSDSTDPTTARFRSPQWRNEATKIYRQVASTYSYVDPKTKERKTDWDAIERAMSNDPVGTIAPIFMGGASYAGRLSSAADKLAALNKARGFTDAARVNELTAKGLKAAQVAGDVTARALNPAASLTSMATKPVVRAVKRALPVSVLDKDGNFLPKVEQAIRDAGFDPNLYSSPEYRAHFQDILSKNGITPSAIRKAVGTAPEGVTITRSMAAGERAPSEFKADVADIRKTGEQAINRQMEQQFGHGPDERDLGGSFVRSYTNAKNGVDNAYQQAFSHRGVFTNTDNFTAGVRDAINQELGSMGLDIDTIMTAPRFAQTQNALGGMRRGERKFGGIFQQFDELAGNTGAPVVRAPDLSGEIHTFNPEINNWVDASGNPVRAPAKIQYLDEASGRLSRPQVPAGGQNGLTPQNIDGVRRDVNSFFTEAKTAEDRAALAAINRGIDNYIEQNAANFTGNGAQLSRDLQNARTANQQFISNFDKSPNKVIRDASKLTAANLVPDEAGVLQFAGDPANISAHLEGRIIDPKTLQPKVNYTGGNTVTGDSVFNDLYNVFDPEGQNALVAHVRNTAATSLAPPESFIDFVNRTPFFSNPEKEAAMRLQNARGIVTEQPGAPSTLSEGTGTRWGMRISAPIIGQGVGSTIGGAFGPAGSQIGGWLGTAAGSALEGKMEGLTRASRYKQETEGLLRPEVTAPRLFAPITAAEAVTGISGQSPLVQQPAPQPAPKAPAPAPAPQQAGPKDPYALPASFGTTQPSAKPSAAKDPYALPSGFTESKEDPYALPSGFEEQPQPQYRGGRAAYKSGGKVGHDIEPLVRHLVNKAHKVKKMSNKATEPLLNQHDNAIATALEAAQKAI